MVSYPKILKHSPKTPTDDTSFINRNLSNRILNECVYRTVFGDKIVGRKLKTNPSIVDARGIENANFVGYL